MVSSFKVSIVCSLHDQRGCRVFPLSGGMTPPPSIRHGVRVVPPEGTVTVEDVLQVGHGNLSFASRMNIAEVVFVEEERHVHHLLESGVIIREVFVQVSLLSTPSTQITVSSVLPFICNYLLQNEFRRFAKFGSGFKTVSLGCKDLKLKHVQSLRQQVFMFLDSLTQTLEVSFRVKHGDGFYMVYAISGQLKCFECGDEQAKCIACLHKLQAAMGELTGGEAMAGVATGGASGAASGAAGVADIS